MHHDCSLPIARSALAHGSRRCACRLRNGKREPAKETPVVAPLKGDSKTIDLFDGKTTQGWEGYEDLWSVHDGAIVAKNEKPLKFSTYLLTKDKFSDFRLILAAKLVTSEMHSGVAFWGIVKPDVSKENGERPHQAHLLRPSGGVPLWLRHVGSVPA